MKWTKYIESKQIMQNTTTYLKKYTSGLLVRESEISFTESQETNYEKEIIML